MAKLTNFYIKLLISLLIGWTLSADMVGNAQQLSDSVQIVVVDSVTNVSNAEISSVVKAVPFLTPEKIESTKKSLQAPFKEQHPFYADNKSVISQIEPVRFYQNDAFDFYMVTILLLILGVLRAVNPHYFKTLLKAFTNPTLNTRQLKEQLQQNTTANFAMNTFYCISAGMYMYYLVEYVAGVQVINQYSTAFILLSAIGLFCVIYTIRYFSLRFASWAFNIEALSDVYGFNVFLVNKILGIVLIPFTIMMALGNGQIVQVSLFISLTIIGLSFLNRYARSQAAFVSFINFSKFHFFVYLCASELLPLAVLLKLLYEWLLH